MADEEEKNLTDELQEDGYSGPPGFEVPQQNPNIHEASIFPQKELSIGEQRDAAVKAEQDRQMQNQEAGEMNDRLGGINLIKKIKNRNGIGAIRKKISLIQKENLKNEKELHRTLRKKKIKLIEDEGKEIMKIIRIAGETITGVSIPVAIWEAIKLGKNSKDIVELRNEIKKLKKKIITDKNNYNKEVNNLFIELYNLQNFYNIQAANDSSADEAENLAA